MIEVSEPVEGFLKITDENYELDKWCIVDRFLKNLDYALIVDFKINLTVDLPLSESTIFLYPKDKQSNFIESLKNLENIKSEFESIKDREVKYSFELLLLRQGCVHDEDDYENFFKKQKEGKATIDDVPIVKKLNNNEKLTDSDLAGYILMLSMGILE